MRHLNRRGRAHLPFYWYTSRFVHRVPVHFLICAPRSSVIKTKPLSSTESTSVSIRPHTHVTSALPLAISWRHHANSHSLPEPSADAEKV